MPTAASTHPIAVDPTFISRTSLQSPVPARSALTRCRTPRRPPRWRRRSTTSHITNIGSENECQTAYLRDLGRSGLVGGDRGDLGTVRREEVDADAGGGERDEELRRDAEREADRHDRREGCRLARRQRGHDEDGDRDEPLATARPARPWRRRSAPRCAAIQVSANHAMPNRAIRPMSPDGHRALGDDVLDVDLAGEHDHGRDDAHDDLDHRLRCSAAPGRPSRRGRPVAAARTCRAP